MSPDTPTIPGVAFERLILFSTSCRPIKNITIIIIIALLTIVSGDQWGDLEDLECLYKACQAARTEGGLFTDTGVDERGENERQSENDCEMKTVSRVKGPENQQE